MNNFFEYLKTKITCWYPSSGADINSINYWRNNLGNQIIPNVFIFTDNAFRMTENSLSINENKNMIDTLNGLGFIKTHYEEIEDVENFRQALINDNNLLNKLDLSVMKNYLKDNQTQEWNVNIDLKEIGLSDNSSIISNQEFLDIFNTHFNEILIKNLNLIENDDCLWEFFPARKLSFKNEQLNTELIFIKTKNESFYDQCIENNIKISCFQLKRHKDDFFNGFKLTNLNIQEAILHNNDLNCISKEFTVIHSFQWISHFYTEDAKIIKVNY
jgi:hypothetical protein